MRKQIITMMVSFAALFLFVASVCAAPVSGGWSITDDTSITPEAQEVFDQAMESFTGVGYEPVDLLATQVVAGTNYCFLCRGTVIVPDATRNTITYISTKIWREMQNSLIFRKLQLVKVSSIVLKKLKQQKRQQSMTRPSRKPWN